MNERDRAEVLLVRRLREIDMLEKPAYAPAEVSVILGIGRHAFCRLLMNYERDQETGLPRSANMLASYSTAGHAQGSRRVAFDDLVDFMVLNPAK